MAGRKPPMIRRPLQHYNHRCHFSYTPTAPPPLFDLCVRKSFAKALQRAQTHPREAAFKHPRNWTALHCCVEHVAPLDVVRAIYEAHPQNVVTKDWQGYTPVEAAVDLETKEFLRQKFDALAGSESKDDSAITTTHVGKEQTSVSSNAPITTAKGVDAALLGKVIHHANNLSDQVTELSAAANRLQMELDALKETLRSISKD